MGVYARLLRNRRYRLVWVGATLSIVGDGAAWVALAWTAFRIDGSAADVGALLVAYTAPVVFGGPLVGLLLDRFDRRLLLVADNVVRSAAMAAVPLLHVFGVLRLWHLFAAAAIYGLLKMVPLAGIPALLPDLVADEELDAANAMESFGWMLGSVLGPAIGGALLAVVDGPYVLVLDAVTYLGFAAALLAAGPIASARVDEGGGGRGLRPAVALVFRTPIVLATTVMFMLLNVGEGMVAVLLPVFVDEAGRGATTYGALLAVAAGAGLAGAAVAGVTGGRVPYGRAIACSQSCAGLILLVLAADPPLAAAFAAIAGSWFFLGPLTVWAQSVRMRVIPAHLRGRVFGLLRTAMQGTLPLGGALAPVVAAGGVGRGLAVAALLVAVPGLVGLFHPALAARQGPEAAVLSADR